MLCTLGPYTLLLLFISDTLKVGFIPKRDKWSLQERIAFRLVDICIPLRMAFAVPLIVLVEVNGHIVVTSSLMILSSKTRWGAD